jgi:hypothetical protein
MRGLQKTGLSDEKAHQVLQGAREAGRGLSELPNQSRGAGGSGHGGLNLAAVELWGPSSI